MSSSFDTAKLQSHKRVAYNSKYKFDQSKTETIDSNI